MPSDGVGPLQDDRWRDRLGGILLMALGMSAAYTATGYNVGTLTRMGPGFVPAVLGAVLAAVGLVLVATTLPARRERVGGRPPIAVADPMIGGTSGPEWRGWICICAGILVFAGLAERTGLLPATLASVFVTALGDRENTFRSAALLALGMAAGAVVVFWWGLGVLLPLVTWDFG